ncbi:MAG: MBL fold metallo-hydrolase [Gammaproteobacteria bacterium]|jgi:glyoxylase-like metal-dependent hydrolase (beta-lactamase superfamily II)|nr:MBL fold metallo-hydrolase [Gammaproteobacteria bacterium]
MLKRVLQSVPTAALLLAGSAVAQSMEDVEIGVESIGSGVHMLTGRGGNIGLVATEDGAFLIDDQYAPLTDRIVEAVRSVTDQPIKFVLNTHWHGDHTGGNENLAENQGTLVVAHDNVRERMSSEQVSEFFGRTTPASPDGALPVVTFNDTISFHLGEHEIRSFHVPHAHTDGDTVVHLPDANVIHAGDTVFYGLYPFVDVDSGGSLPGLIAAVERIAELADGDTVIIPGHGPIIDRKQLLGYHDMLETVEGRLEEAIDEGMSLEEIQEAGLTAEYDEQWGGGFIPPDRWIELLHRSMTESSEGHDHDH